MRLIIVVSLLIIINALTANAQDWRQIAPLKTTRMEVERLLGPSKEVYVAEYRLEEESLFIEYASGPCRPDRKGGWNVAKDVVISMRLSPKHPKKYPP